MRVGLTKAKLTLSLGIAASVLVACGGGGGGGSSTTGGVTSGPTPTPPSIMWTWVSGSNGIGITQGGSYGTRGVASLGNVPGARSNAATWADSAGNLWMFGGYGKDAGTFTPVGLLNDLWKFSPSTGMWTWVSGSSAANAPADYGVLGTPAVSNVPGARRAASAWIDSVGELWLFGGYGKNATGLQADLNDLWKFSPTAGVWTWISGSNTINGVGVYGIKGVAATTNMPGSRFNASTWIDSFGNLWLFGGDNDTTTGSTGLYNDLWRFNPNALTWTWIDGANAACSNVSPPTPAPDCSPVYGTRGVASTNNQPSARVQATAGRDSTGKFWLFGGLGFGLVGTQGPMNDLWQYDPTAGTWTWVSGANVANAAPVYGSQGIAAAGNILGARTAHTSWTDAAGNIWIFGGIGFDSSNAQKSLNDLWKYAPSSGTWTWMSGSTLGNAVSVHGTRGAPASTNVPGARYLSSAWVDASANLWLFGGVGSTTVDFEQNDLWRLAP